MALELYWIQVGARHPCLPRLIIHYDQLCDDNYSAILTFQRLGDEINTFPGVNIGCDMVCYGEQLPQQNNHKLVLKTMMWVGLVRRY